MVNMSTDIDLPLSEIILKKKITLNRQRAGNTASGGVVKAKVITSKTATQKMAIQKVGDARNKIVQLKRNHFKDARDQLAQIAKTGDVRDKLNKIRKIETNSGSAAVKKPLDMRQKLNQKKGNTQIKKISLGKQQLQGKLNATRGRIGLQTQGSNIVRTVQGNRNAQSNASNAQRRPISAPGATSVTRTISVPTGAGGPVRRAPNNAQSRTSRGPYPISVQGQTRTIVRQNRNAVKQLQPRATVVRQTQVQRTVPQNTVYVREEPQTVYQQVPAARSSATSRARLEPLHQPRTRYVVEDEYLPEVAPQRPTIVYRTLPQEEVVYADDVSGFAEYQDEQPVYYEDQTDSMPYYEPQYTEVYVPPPGRSQQQYRTPQPRSQQQYVSSQPRSQQQYVSSQPRSQQQYVSSQPRSQQQYGPAPPPLMQQSKPYSNYSSSPQSRGPSFVSRTQAVKRSAPAVRQFTRPTPAPKVVGHKVCVSNLRAATREDIEELFGNIGPISQCLMPRPDTANVIFLNLQDAKKSVEVYHNRKLDNHPMQVKIIGTVTESSTPIRSNRVRTVY